jgi:hypothetical protein
MVFDLMRLSGRTVAIKATPADLPASEARNMLSELLETVDPEKKGSAREVMRDEIAASTGVSRGNQGQHATRAGEDALVK